MLIRRVVPPQDSAAQRRLLRAAAATSRCCCCCCRQANTHLRGEGGVGVASISDSVRFPTPELALPRHGHDFGLSPRPFLCSRTYVQVGRSVVLDVAYF